MEVKFRIPFVNGILEGGGGGKGSLSSTSFPEIFRPLLFSEGKSPGSEVALN